LADLDSVASLRQLAQLALRLAVLGLLRPKLHPEKVFNYSLALSVLSWAVLGLASADGLTAPVRWVVAALHITVAALLVLRSPVVIRGSFWSISASIPALVAAGWALKIAPHPRDWSVSAQVLFAAGGLLAIVSFLYLGSSFAVLPALRKIVTKGPYRFVRHPAYIGELTMIFACFIARPALGSISTVLAALPLVILRVHAEEQFLTAIPLYQNYAKLVRWRLLPGLW
jgi:protein-S-isoprenylcysteine O-methyltransferase Ste14